MHRDVSAIQRHIFFPLHRKTSNAKPLLIAKAEAFEEVHDDVIVQDLKSGASCLDVKALSVSMCAQTRSRTHTHMRHHITLVV